MKKILNKIKSILTFVGGIFGFLFFIRAMIKQEDEEIQDITSKNDNLADKNTLILDDISVTEEEIDDLDDEISIIKEEIEGTEEEDPGDTEVKDFFKNRGF